MRIWLAAILLVVGIGVARAISPGQQIILFGGNSSASAPPAATGKILRIDGTSHILRIDGTSKICRLGGC